MRRCLAAFTQQRADEQIAEPRLMLQRLYCLPGVPGQRRSFVLSCSLDNGVSLGQAFLLVPVEIENQRIFFCLSLDGLHRPSYVGAWQANILFERASSTSISANSSAFRQRVCLRVVPVVAVIKENFAVLIVRLIPPRSQTGFRRASPSPSRPKPPAKVFHSRGRISVIGGIVSSPSLVIGIDRPHMIASNSIAPMLRAERMAILADTDATVLVTANALRLLGYRPSK